MDIDEGMKWLRRKLERSWNKMVPEAQEITKEKYEAAMKILADADNSNPSLPG
jgi:hypothetical protein